ncbi:hypothetical protein HKX48_001267, partial [Thoreauomyces humboldtii]
MSDDRDTLLHDPSAPIPPVQAADVSTSDQEEHESDDDPSSSTVREELFDMTVETTFEEYVTDFNALLATLPDNSISLSQTVFLFLHGTSGRTRQQIQRAFTSGELETLEDVQVAFLRSQANPALWPVEDGGLRDESDPDDEEGSEREAKDESRTGVTSKVGHGRSTFLGRIVRNFTESSSVRKQLLVMQAYYLIWALISSYTEEPIYATDSVHFLEAFAVLRNSHAWMKWISRWIKLLFTLFFLAIVGTAGFGLFYPDVIANIYGELNGGNPLGFWEWMSLANLPLT